MPKPTVKKTTAKPKPKTVEHVVTNLEEEFPYDMFPWKLIYKDGSEKRTCYFECEEHRKKYIDRYKLTKKHIIFIGYKFE